MKDLRALVRPNIQVLVRRQTKAEQQANAVATDAVRLDCGESPFNEPNNRHVPATSMQALRQAFANDKRVGVDMVELLAGNDTPLDLVLRTFCTPQRDNIVVPEPSPLKYAHIAQLNEVECRHVALDDAFQLTAQAALVVANRNTKVVYLASPNYPTGNLLARAEVLKLADSFDGIVVVDETFVEYARAKSLTEEIPNHPNLIVIGSLAAAYASAALEVGYVIAHPDVAKYLHALVSHTSLALPVITEASELLTRRRFDVDKWVKWLLEERTKVIAALKLLPFCRGVYPSDANFLLMRFAQAPQVYAHLVANNIRVADCTSLPACKDCLCITIGLTGDNNALLSALRNFVPTPTE